MLESGTDPESYITEYTSVYEDYTCQMMTDLSAPPDENLRTGLALSV